MPLLLWLVLACLTLFTGGSLPAQSGLFDNSEKQGSGLIAIIYDLKQTQARKPSTVSAQDYTKVVGEFITKGWDEVVLNRYFRVTRPLYSSQIFIPGLNAGEAPKAYGVEKIIEPSRWVIHYKGQVSPPEDGTYRFAAYADDVIAVAVNNKTVCLVSRSDMDLTSVWKSPVPEKGVRAYNGDLGYGEWVAMKKDQPIDLDVLVGERPGAEFCAFLLYQKQGVEYAKNPEGQLILPVFQLTAQEIPAKDDGKSPLFLKSSALWKQHQ